MFVSVFSRLRSPLLAIGCAFLCQCLLLAPGQSRATAVFDIADPPSSLSLTRIAIDGLGGLFKFYKIGATPLTGATLGLHRDSTRTGTSGDHSFEWWAERNWAFDGNPLVQLQPHSMRRGATRWLSDFLLPFGVADLGEIFKDYVSHGRNWHEHILEDDVLVVTIPEQTTGLLLGLGVAGLAATSRPRRFVYRPEH